MNSRGLRLGSSFAFVAGAVCGAALMALLDPGRGAQRRSYVRDKMTHATRIAAREGAKQLKRLRNELVGGLAERKAHLLEREIPDEKLVARVRAQLGHVVKHLGLLEIEARQGHVTIWGPVLRRERNKILERLEETRGVENCYLQIDEHDSLDRVAGMRGRQPAEQSRRAS